VNKKEIGAMMF
jgi:hypothetical protein